MPKLGPIKRNELIKFLMRLDFEGPFSGGKHQFMNKDNLTIRIPNSHQSDIGKELLSKILRQAKIKKDIWELL